MKKLISYKLSVEEATKIIQNVTGDKELRMINELWYYVAESDNQFLDSTEIDECLATALNIPLALYTNHFVDDYGYIYIVDRSSEIVN